MRFRMLVLVVLFGSFACFDTGSLRNGDRRGLSGDDVFEADVSEAPEADAAHHDAVSGDDGDDAFSGGDASRGGDGSDAAPDSETPDVGTPDSGTPDTGEPDAGTPDVGTPDVGAPDAGTPDTGEPDTGEPDTGEPDTGEPDVGAPEPLPLDCRNLASWPSEWRSFEEEVVALFNERRARGATCGSTAYPPAGPLTMQPNVYQAARCHSLDQARGNFMSHTGSDGSSMGQRMTREGYSWRAAAENVARGQRSPAEVVNAWMNSPGHCQNIMGNYTHVGVGYVRLQGGSHFWTANFGRSR